MDGRIPVHSVLLIHCLPRDVVGHDQARRHWDLARAGPFDAAVQRALPGAGCLDRQSRSGALFTKTAHPRPHRELQVQSRRFHVPGASLIKLSDMISELVILLPYSSVRVLQLVVPVLKLHLCFFLRHHEPQHVGVFLLRRCFCAEAVQQPKVMVGEGLVVRLSHHWLHRGHRGHRGHRLHRRHPSEIGIRVTELDCSSGRRHRPVIHLRSCWLLSYSRADEGCSTPWHTRAGSRLRVVLELSRHHRC
mmetsp:Transcript_4595/g.8716  ORF Transcript_4595/g.8716 Transcript_4595/m.8716 type:complete len:248 (-) Transcript_4595:332-1075(-)